MVEPPRPGRVVWLSCLYPRFCMRHGGGSSHPDVAPEPTNACTRYSRSLADHPLPEGTISSISFVKDVLVSLPFAVVVHFALFSSLPFCPSVAPSPQSDAHVITITNHRGPPRRPVFPLSPISSSHSLPVWSCCGHHCLFSSGA